MASSDSFFPLFWNRQFLASDGSSEMKHRLLEGSSGERRVFHPFLHPCSVHPRAGLARAAEHFFLPLRMLGAASVSGRTSYPCGALGCRQSRSIPPCPDAFNAKIHPRVLVPLPPSWVSECLWSTHYLSRNRIRERIFAQLFFFFSVFALHGVKDLFINCKWPL